MKNRLKDGMKKGILALALTLTVGMTAAPVQAAMADMAPGEAQGAILKQKPKVTLEHTRGKSTKDVKVIKKILEKNNLGNFQYYTDLNGNCYKWTKKGRLSELHLNGGCLKGKVSLKGLTALTIVSVERNHLTNLDVSGNTKLKVLNCKWNKLSKLDVSKNTKLTELECGWNQLTNLNLSKNAKLELLTCPGNKLSKLDVSKNTELKELRCDENQLTSLDLSNNPLLNRGCVSCDDNVTVTYYSDSAQ